MRHPFESIPANKRGYYFWPLLTLTLAIMLVMNQMGAPLTTEAAPAGIVSYELAGSVDQAQKILASWDISAREYAAFGLGFDYLFMVAYSLTIALGCVWGGAVLMPRRWPLAGLAVPLAWGAWLAAVLDAVENLALTWMLFNMPASPWPELARICALFKFAFVLLGIVYILYALLAGLLSRPASKEGLSKK
jgi:hypothetical protein